MTLIAVYFTTDFVLLLFGKLEIHFTVSILYHKAHWQNICSQQLLVHWIDMNADAMHISLIVHCASVWLELQTKNLTLCLNFTLKIQRWRRMNGNLCGFESLWQLSNRDLVPSHPQVPFSSSVIFCLTFSTFYPTVFRLVENLSYEITHTLCVCVYRRDSLLLNSFSAHSFRTIFTNNNAYYCSIIHCIKVDRLFIRHNSFLFYFNFNSEKKAF